MIESPNFGPYLRWESVSEFDAISVDAQSLFGREVEIKRSRFSRPLHHLFLRLEYQGRSTSLAVRLVNSWALGLPALALLRVRLEQVIVSSYLTHEDQDVALLPYVSYIPVQDFRGASAAMEDPGLAAQLRDRIDMARAQREATTAQSELTPGFTLEGGKLQRKWTKLDLRSMARRRDRLVANDGAKPLQLLEREYLAIYKTASSPVHADASAVSRRFLNIYAAQGTQPALMTDPSWSVIVAASVAAYDVLQCCETLAFLEIPTENHYERLMRRWIAARDKHLGSSRRDSDHGDGTRQREGLGEKPTKS